MIAKVSSLAVCWLLSCPTVHVRAFRSIRLGRLFRRQQTSPFDRRANSNNGSVQAPIPIVDESTVSAAVPVGPGLDLLPEMHGLFETIQQASPLAKLVIEREQRNGLVGINAGWHNDRKRVATTKPKESQARLFHVDDDHNDNAMSRWKSIESNNRGSRPITSIERWDRFQNVDAPLLRFRASLEGPCVADPLASLIMILEERSKWDIQIQDVYEAYTIKDLASANAAMGFEYGNCYRLGVGYCRTKKNLGIDAREQLTLCGINQFADGSSMIWGVELPESHNDLMPSHYDRVTRAKSHLFSTTLVPTSESTFDVEYVLQLEIGGKIPTWLTTPIVTDSVKRMFKCAKGVYADQRIEIQRTTTIASDHLLLRP